MTKDYLDLEKRGKHRGTCTAEFSPFADGECYTCMFLVDDDCPYLVDTRANNPKLEKFVKESRRI